MHSEKSSKLRQHLANFCKRSIMITWLVINHIPFSLTLDDHVIHDHATVYVANQPRSVSFHAVLSCPFDGSSVCFDGYS
jgi:hypothetical protein